MAKRATKSKRTKKTVAKEANEYEVTVNDTSIGSSTPSQTTMVRTTSADQAVDQATAGQQAVDAESITVKKVDPMKSKTAPNGTNKGVVEKAPTMKQITESVSYPYPISLPMQFETFLKEHDFDTTSIGNTVMVKFESKKALTEALRKLNKSDDAKAKIILDGIGRSI